MKKYLENEKGFYSLIGLLVALAVLFFFVYYVINTYFGSGLPQQQGVTAPAGSSNAAANYQSVIKSTKENINKMNTKTMEQLQQVEELKK